MEKEYFSKSEERAIVEKKKKDPVLDDQSATVPFSLTVISSHVQ